MPRFRYSAFTDTGRRSDGEIEAISSESAMGALSSRGLIVFAVSDADESHVEPWWRRELWRHRVKSSSLAAFTRELATLVGAEVALDEALRIIAAEDSGAGNRRLAERILREVLQGAALSTALSAASPGLPAYYVSMLKAGETSGTLRNVLGELAQLLERSIEAQSRLRSLLLYPALLVIMALAAIILVITVLVPAIAPLLADAGVELPTTIKILLAVTRFVHEFWPLVGAAMFGTLILAGALFSRSELRLQLDRGILRVPVIGRSLAKLETARFARTLASLLKGGVPLVSALESVSGVNTNRAMGAALVDVLEMVKTGRSLVGAMRDVGIFPAVSVRLVGIGEETGRLEDMLMHVAQVFESQVQRSAERWMSVLTPALTVIIGVGVGALMLSVMSAIVSVNDIALR